MITTQRLCQLMHYIRYGNSAFAKFIQYCIQSVVQVVAQKFPYAVCWKASKASETLIRKRRTLAEPFDFAEI